MGPLIEVLPIPYTDAVVATGAAILGLLAGIVGVTAVLRERTLVADALSHAALPGIALAFLLTGAKDPASLLVGAAIAGLIGAVMIVGIERTGRIRADAAIGVVLSGFFSIGIVLISYIASTDNSNQAGLSNYLFGQAAGLVERDVNTYAVLALVTLGLLALAYRPLKATLFDPAFAGSLGLPTRALELFMTALLVCAVIVGLRTVGAILMVAMIAVPAAAARQFTNRLGTMLPLAGALGATIGVAGALISTASEAPTGPVIVLLGLAMVVLALAFAPGRGFVWRARELRRARRRRLVEGVLIDVETAMHAGPPPTARELELASGRAPSELRTALRDLDRAGLLEHEGERLILTEAGAAAAHTVLEQRDLWSAWLEYGSQLDLGDAREPDPTNLRGSLGDEAVDRLRALAAGERP
ncbi:MAG TPA: iron chelate uptake ABC transporter family permease subunit [Solirubrobacterales bacterium]|nr:iron chelate uptake ABC transporter family permease subunit [Solirubrobacterales bacterium]